MSPRANPRGEASADVALEQAFVDWCMARLHGKASAFDPSVVGGDRHTVRALDRVAETKRRLIEASEDRLVVGRVDLEDGETFRIGRQVVTNDEDDILLVSWQAPFAARFYEASRSDPMGVGRRRNISMTASRVTQTDDELLIRRFVPPRDHLEVPPPPPSSMDVSAPTEVGAGETEQFIDLRDPAIDLREPAAADRGQPDSDDEPAEDEASQLEPEPEMESELDSDDAMFAMRAPDLLLEELEAERTGVMGEVLATLQGDQYRLVRAERERPVVIQGGPGTGKTVVALHRAAWVLYHEQAATGTAEVLIVGPNRRFLDYVRGVLPALGEHTSEQLSIDELALSQLQAGELAGLSDRDALPTTTDPVARAKADPAWVGVIEAAVWAMAAPVELALPLGLEVVRLSQSAVGSVLARLRRRGSWDEARAELLEELVASFLEARQARAERAGRTVSGDHASAQQAMERWLTENRVVDRVLPRIGPKQVIRRLLEDDQLLDAVGSGLLSEDRELLRATGQHRWTKADLPLLAEAASVIRGAPSRFAHVVVDEAQDLSPMQWRVVTRRMRGTSITIAGDLAQATTPYSPPSWDEVLTEIGAKGVGVVGELQIGYRVPVEVMELAALLLPDAAPNVLPPRSFRSEYRPQTRKFNKVGDLRDALVAAVETASNQPGLTCVIVPAAALRRTTEALDGVMPTDGSVVVLDDRSVHGLEFDHVIVVEPARIVDGTPVGLRRLYVCLTRATRDLTIFHTQKLPAQLLGSIDPSQRFRRSRTRWGADEEHMLRWEHESGWPAARMAVFHQRSPEAIQRKLATLRRADRDRALQVQHETV